jgi:hypothetical protein
VAKLAHTLGDRANLELKTRGVKAADELGTGRGRGALPQKREGEK